MKRTKFVRKGHLILAGKDRVFTGESINAAKRESRRLQLAEDGALGRGSVKRVRG